MRQTLFHGKKGAQLFMFLLVGLTLIIFPLFYTALAAKTEQFENQGAESNKIGEKQLAVLKASQEAEKAQLYLELAAEYAYGTAVAATARNGYLEGDECPQYRGVPILYGDPEHPDCMAYDELEKQLTDTLTTTINDALTPYLEAYEETLIIPQHTYILSFENNRVIGKGEEPIEVPLFAILLTTRLDEIQQQTVTGRIQFSQWPVQYDEHRVNSCFGYRGGDVVSGKSKGSTYHPGIDIRGPKGTPILAIGAGTVTVVSPTRWGRVVVDHGNGIYSEYLHMDTTGVHEGQFVQTGTELGTTGGRGKNGPDDYAAHLHFGIIDTNIAAGLRDAQNNKAVLTSFDSDHFVNPLCYFDTTVSYTSKNNLGCRSQGGPLKFCGLYQQQTGVTVSTTATTTYKVTPSTTAMLKEIDATYGDIIEDAIAGTSISKPLVIGLIAQESSGNPNAGSNTGCQGLMQFCAETAYGYGLCDNKKCSGRDERRNPEKAIPAGVKLLIDDINTFKSSYTDREAFGLAAYNTGAGLVKATIEATGKTNPTWEEVSAALTANIVGRYLKGEYFDTTEERNGKVKEISDYPRSVQTYAAAYGALDN